MMVLFGGSSGAVPLFDLVALSQKGSLYVTRPTLGNYIATREELIARSGAVFGMIAAGKLKLRIEHVYPLVEAQQAHRDLEGRKTKGSQLERSWGLAPGVSESRGPARRPSRPVPRCASFFAPNPECRPGIFAGVIDESLVRQALGSTAGFPGVRRAHCVAGAARGERHLQRGQPARSRRIRHLRRDGRPARRPCRHGFSAFHTGVRALRT